MDGDWDLGGYNFNELRILWNTLKTQQVVDDIAVQKLPRQEDRNRYNLRVAKRSDWVDHLASLSALELGTVETIFANLVYNPSLHQDVGKRGHVMFQPFFDLGGDQIGGSNSLVMISAVEKCTWMLCELLITNGTVVSGTKRKNTGSRTSFGVRVRHTSGFPPTEIPAR